MIELNRTQQAQIRRGELTRTELESIVMSYPMGDIITTCVELLIKDSFATTPKIVLTQREFNSHFRIIGMKDDGTTEKRGRPKKEQEEEIFPTEED